MNNETKKGNMQIKSPGIITSRLMGGFKIGDKLIVSLEFVRVETDVIGRACYNVYFDGVGEEFKTELSFVINQKNHFNWAVRQLIEFLYYGDVVREDIDAYIDKHKHEVYKLNELFSSGAVVFGG